MRTRGKIYTRNIWMRTEQNYNNFWISKTDKKDRFGGLFLLPKIGKIKCGKFGNLTNRNAIISRAKLQTEKHRQSTDFSQFPDNGKLQFNGQKCNQITNRNAIRLQTERKKMRKRKERSKEKNKEQKKDIKRSEEYILYNICRADPTAADRHK